MGKDSKKVSKYVFILAIVIAVGLSACGLGSGSFGSLTGNAANGETVYIDVCASCHGPDATGIPSVGNDLVNNEFTDGLSDQEYIDFLIEGRLASDPANIMEEDMPPKGDNPDLTKQDLADVVAYLRTLTE